MDGLVERIARCIVIRATRAPLLAPVLEALARWLGHRAPSARLSRALGFYVGEALTAQADRSLRLARLCDGSQVALRPGGHLWNALYLFGVYEEETTAFVRDWLRPGDTVVDVGANVGYYSMIAARRVGAGGHVHAFEPQPDVVGLLRHSVTVNGYCDRVTVVSKAVSDRPGSVQLALPPDADRTGEASIISGDDTANWRTVEVEATTIEDYCAERSIGSIRLLKVDAEGAEFEVLKGSERLLADGTVEAIVCEIVPSRRPEALTATLQLLDRHGYSACTMDAFGVLVPHGPTVPDWIWGNLCFVRPRREQARNSTLVPPPPPFGPAPETAIH